MPLSHNEHLLLLVDDVDTTADWFVDHIGLERCHTPDFNVPVTWLYIGERDVLHIDFPGSCAGMPPSTCFPARENRIGLLSW